MGDATRAIRITIYCLACALPVWTSAARGADDATSAATGAPVAMPEQLGDGDSVKITVYQNPDLATETRIAPDGTINFPLIGQVNVGGLTPAAAEARIAEMLAKGNFILRPQVSVTIAQVRSRQVSVLGEVTRPGRYPLDGPGQSLTDILALAGGISAAGDSHVLVTRNRAGTTTSTSIDVAGMYRTGDLSRNMRLENGDVVYVERAPQFYVYGEVQRAGVYRLEPNMTVMQALSVSGGITQRGTLHGLQIQRRASDGRVHKIAARPTDVVQADDVIAVRERLF